MIKNIKTNLILLFLLTLTTLSLINAPLITKEIITYTKLFIAKLFPSSFLFLTLSSLLIDYKVIEKLGKIIPINANIFILLMSMISGFPSGSIYIKKLLMENKITLEDANYLIRFTHFPNPIFILGPISFLFKNKKAPIKILLSLIIANLLIALIFYKKKKKSPKNIELSPTPSFISSLTSATTMSIKSCLLIYETSVFSYLVGKTLTNILKPNLLLHIIISGLFDLTNGVFLTSLLSNETIRGIIILIFFSFGGISVNMQIKSIISDTNIKYKNFLQGRILQIVLSTTLFLWII